MQVGDKIRFRTVKGDIAPTIYELIDFNEESVTVKHPDIAGLFTFSKKWVAETLQSKQTNKETK